MKFKTWQDMYECLKNGQDLYNPQIQEYVFLYNEDGAISAVYENIRIEFVK